jgi:hypothetical protein
MTTRRDNESRRVGLLHRLSDRGTGCQERLGLGKVTHRTSRPPTELPDRALEQFDQAGETLVHPQKELDGSSPAENRAGRCYRVCFMNRFARGRNTITACQRNIVIPSAPSRKAAIEVAKQRFAELEGIPNWQIHASFIEAGLIEDDDAAAAREPDEQRSADDNANLLAPE